MVYECVQCITIDCWTNSFRDWNGRNAKLISIETSKPTDIRHIHLVLSRFHIHNYTGLLLPLLLISLAIIAIPLFRRQLLRKAYDNQKIVAMHRKPEKYQRTFFIFWLFCRLLVIQRILAFCHQFQNSERQWSAHVRCMLLICSTRCLHHSKKIIHFIVSRKRSHTLT